MDTKCALVEVKQFDLQIASAGMHGRAAKAPRCAQFLTVSRCAVIVALAVFKNVDGLLLFCNRVFREDPRLHLPIGI
jgi:hypothetical protein